LGFAKTQGRVIVTDDADFLRLAEGARVEEILADFPTLTAEDVRAVVAFAAAPAEFAS
jgi:uncharacterized protein (DUF433 family)